MVVLIDLEKDSVQELQTTGYRPFQKRISNPCYSAHVR